MTYEELKKSYPVGKILHEKVITNNFTRIYYNKKDLTYYKSIYKEVKIQDENTCICTEIRRVVISIEGWLHDGKEWMPAYETWDGWIPYTKEELEEYK